MINTFKSRLMPLIISVFVIIAGSFPLIVSSCFNIIYITILIKLLNSKPNVRWIVYICSAIQGVGLAIMLNTATSLIVHT